MLFHIVAYLSVIGLPVWDDARPTVFLVSAKSNGEFQKARYARHGFHNGFYVTNIEGITMQI